MRARSIVLAIVVVGAIAIVVWRPWGGGDGERGRADVVPAAGAEGAPAAAAAPGVSPPSVVEPRPAEPRPPAPPAPPVASPRAAAAAGAPVADAGAGPAGDAVDDRRRFQALHKALADTTPDVARLYADFARAGRPVPPAVKTLVEKKRAGAGRAELVDFARGAFLELPDRAIIVRWLGAGADVVPGAPAAAAAGVRPAGSPALKDPTSVTGTLVRRDGGG